MPIEEWIPGIAVARNYRKEWFRNDLFAGLSVAAVALPIGIAYAQLAGFSPVIGIYSCILPAIAYAFFGSSKQLVVNPDAAACTIIASTVAPLAGGDAVHYADLSIMLTFTTGALCVLGGLAGFGVIANFLSRPILTGYMNGIALSILVGQLGSLLGYTVHSSGFFRTLIELVSRVNELHVSTFVFGFILICLLILINKFIPQVPGALVVVVVGCVVVYAMDLHHSGVDVVGTIPSGFPMPRIPIVKREELWPLITSAAGIVLVSFCSMMTTARGFAAKRGYSINTNRDMMALGFSDIASSFSRGFVVSGADSRTAVADSTGGKTQLTSIVAAVAMALVLLFLTQPLAYLPRVALSVTLIFSSISLFDFASLRSYYSINKVEFGLSLIAMFGVMTVGVLFGVLIAVGLALLKLLSLASRPHDVELGFVKGDKHNFISIERGGEKIPGLIIYRYDSALLFFNADYFRRRVQLLVEKSELESGYFLLDAESMPLLDITGAQVLKELHQELKNKNIVFGVARTKGFSQVMINKAGLVDLIGKENLFVTISGGVKNFESNYSRSI